MKPTLSAIASFGLVLSLTPPLLASDVFSTIGAGLSRIHSGISDNLPILVPDRRNLDLLTPTKRAQLKQLLRTNQCPKCDLSGVDLRRTNLRGADLAGANLNLVDLSGANLSNANLENATMIFTRLENTVLNSANLRGVILGGDKLGPAASLQGATLPDGTVVAPTSPPDLAP